MDNGGGTVGKDVVPDGLGVCQVKVLGINTAAFDAPGFQKTDGIPAQLTRVSGNENFHTAPPEYHSGFIIHHDRCGRGKTTDSGRLTAAAMWRI